MKTTNVFKRAAMLFPAALLVLNACSSDSTGPRPGKGGNVTPSERRAIEELFNNPEISGAIMGAGGGGGAMAMMMMPGAIRDIGTVQIGGTAAASSATASSDGLSPSYAEIPGGLFRIFGVEYEWVHNDADDNELMSFSTMTFLAIDNLHDPSRIIVVSAFDENGSSLSSGSYGLGAATGSVNAHGAYLMFNNGELVNSYSSTSGILEFVKGSYGSRVSCFADLPKSVRDMMKGYSCFYSYTNSDVKFSFNGQDMDENTIEVPEVSTRVPTSKLSMSFDLTGLGGN